MEYRFTGEQQIVWQHYLFAHKTVMSALESSLATSHLVSLVEYELLVRLVHAPENKLRFIELANVLLITQSGISKLVDRMEKKGYVRRENTALNNRATFAHLTPEGQEVFMTVQPYVFRALETSFFSRFDEAELDQFRDLLTRLIDRSPPTLPLD